MNGAATIERALIVIGVACLGYVATISVHALVLQREMGVALDRVVGDRAPRPSETSAATRGDVTDAPIGRLEIPRLRVSAMVMPGDDETTLRTAVGHLSDTPMPWERGNTALAAHRDTFFRPLEHIRPGDDIYLQTPHGRFHYRVRRQVIVDPDDVSVLNATERPTLTLITCYPFRYIGPAPQRFVVQADRI